MSDPTCKERIKRHRVGRLEDMRRILDAMNGNDEDARDEAEQERDTFALSSSTVKTIRVDVSTGGPADWFVFYFDSEDELDGAEYHFADWFDHAEVTLDNDEADDAWEFFGYGLSYREYLGENNA